jgi:hypothetical protein
VGTTEKEEVRQTQNEKLVYNHHVLLICLAIITGIAKRTPRQPEKEKKRKEKEINKNKGTRQTSGSNLWN